jgi:dihydrofolate reductase
VRRLILQVQISLDGFVGAKEGSIDPFLWNWGPDWVWDAPLQKYHTELIESADLLLLSRRMGAEGFVDFWADVATKDGDPRQRFARHITRARKLVFSKRLESVQGENIELTHRDIDEEVDRLKREPGKNMIVWGGASFVSSLIRADLIDEYHLVGNPIAFGSGLPIFSKLPLPRRLKLLDATPYACGVVLSRYERADVRG